MAFHSLYKLFSLIILCIELKEFVHWLRKRRRPLRICFHIDGYHKYVSMSKEMGTFFTTIDAQITHDRNSGYR